MRAGLRRPATEVVLVKPDHRVRDLREDACPRVDVVGHVLLVGGHAATFPSLGAFALLSKDQRRERGSYDRRQRRGTPLCLGSRVLVARGPIEALGVKDEDSVTGCRAPCMALKWQRTSRTDHALDQLDAPVSVSLAGATAPAPVTAWSSRSVGDWSSRVRSSPPICW